MPVVCKLLQGFEAYVGWLFLRKAFVGVVSEWQVRETAYFSSADFTSYPEKRDKAKYPMKISTLFPFLVEYLLILGCAAFAQVVFCGFLLVLMAVGNFTNTVETLLAKSRFKAKMRSKSMKQL